MTRDQKPTIWMRRPCDSWCTTVHRDIDALPNRECVYEPPGVPLTLSAVHEGGENHGPQLAQIAAGLEWGPREVNPHIALSMPTEVENLTLDEAEDVVALLTELIWLGRRIPDTDT